MSTQAEQPSLVLTRRLADGAIEWIPLDSPQHIPVTPGAAYALIDRADYEAPQTLVAQRQGEDLVIEVGETEVLLLDGFFAALGVAFYPTTDIAGGAGPFSGSPLTPDSPMLAGRPEAEQVVWSAEPADGDPPVDVGERSGASGVSPMLWGGAALVGLGLAAAGGGGGGSSGSSSTTSDTSSVASSSGDDALDTSAPRITSVATAAAIDENSKAGQVVYTATAVDERTVIWSLQPGGDAAAFNINPNSGAVTLINDPDFEAQSNYTFTVLATDDAGNSSEQAVSLAINDLDEIAPTVSSVALTGAVGAQNDTLNAGDTVTVTVTMSENVDVDTSGGAPRIALNIGGSTMFADYVSGSGTSSLKFDYSVQPGDTDNNGIRIRADSLEPNGGVLADAAGNAADLSHGSVANNPSYLVDTAAPTLFSSRPSDEATAVAVGDNVVLTFSENVQTGSGNITISDGSDTRAINVTDGSQVSISGNRVTINPASDLTPERTYNIRIDSGAVTDEAGNAYAGISDSATLNFDTETSLDTSIVVFDLVQGSSSDHSGRTFQSGVSYDIYIRVDSDDASLNTRGRGPGTWDRWEGTANLGSDDRIILVGDGAGVQGASSLVNQVSVGTTAVAWLTSLGFSAGVVQERSFTRATGFGKRDDDDARLFDTSLPAAFLGNQGGQTSTMYFTNMPAGILTSQGLA
jgi:hypothetical protein